MAGKIEDAHVTAHVPIEGKAPDSSGCNLEDASRLLGACILGPVAGALLGPDITARVGKEAMATVGGALQGAWNTACDQFQHHTGDAIMEGVQNAGAAVVFVAAAELCPPVALAVATGAGLAMAYDQLFGERNKARNQELCAIFNKAGSADSRILAADMSRVGSLVGSDVYHTGYALVAGGVGIRPGQALATELKATVPPGVIKLACENAMNVLKGVPGLVRDLPSVFGQRKPAWAMEGVSGTGGASLLNKPNALEETSNRMSRHTDSNGSSKLSVPKQSEGMIPYQKSPTFEFAEALGQKIPETLDGPGWKPSPRNGKLFIRKLENGSEECLIPGQAHWIVDENVLVGVVKGANGETSQYMLDLGKSLSSNVESEGASGFADKGKPLVGNAEYHAKNSDLIRRMQAGGADAKAAGNELVKLNTPMVRAFVSRKENLMSALIPGYESQDLMQEAYLRLVKSAMSFDVNAGTSFASYYRKSLLGAVPDMIQQERAIRIPNSAYSDTVRLVQEEAATKARSGYYPSSEQLAKSTGLSVERVEELLAAERAMKNIDSLDRPLSSEQTATGADPREITVLDTIADAKAVDPSEVSTQASLNEELEKMLNRLKPRERDILKQVFGYNGSARTVAEIAESYGISASRASQICRRAMYSLRRMSNQTGLKDFLPAVPMLMLLNEMREQQRQAKSA